MKRSISATIILGGLTVGASNANAQNSVSLYGLLDTGFTYVSNATGARQFELTACNASGCRLGIKGSEDLGGNLRAIFTLENAFSPLTGKIKDGGTFFGRRAFVGFDGDWGSVTIGRHYSTISDMVGKFESGGDWAAAGIGYGEHPDDVDNLNSSFRINNSIKYTSLNYSGFSFGGLYSLGGVAGHASENQVVSFAAAYANGPFKMAVGYQAANDPNRSLYGTDADASSTGNNAPSNIVAGYATAHSQQVFATGASYTIGRATFGAVFSNVVFRHLGNLPISGLSDLESGFQGNTHFDTGELNFKYQFTPALLLGVGAFITKGNGVEGLGEQIYRQINFGGDYVLSKTTDLFALAVYQHARGHDSTGAQVVAAIDGASPSNSNHQIVTLVGMRNRF